MPLDAGGPLCFCTCTPASVPPCLGVCVAVAAPQTLFRLTCCLSVRLRVRGWLHPREHRARSWSATVSEKPGFF